MLEVVSASELPLITHPALLVWRPLKAQGGGFAPFSSAT